MKVRVEAEVRRASLELSAAEKNVARSEAAVTAAEEQHRLAGLLYDNGKGILLEVLDALTALTRARSNRLQALYEHSVARDRLLRAMGIIAASEPTATS
jgi:outer membrane protein TolC